MVIILLLSAFILLQAVIEGTVLHKCCPLGFQVVLKGHDWKCREIKNYSAPPEDDFQWFPNDALCTPDHKPLSEDEQNKFIASIPKAYGMYNLSCKNVQYQAYVSEIESFRILVNEGGKFDVTMSVPEHPDDDFTVANHSTLPLNEVCFESMRGMHIILYCSGYSTHWIHKCCPSKMMINASSPKGECINYPTGLKISDWKPHNLSKELPDHFLVRPLRFRLPCNSEKVILRQRERERNCRGFTLKESKFHFLANGTMMIQSTLFNSDEYCGDKTWYSDNEIIHQNVVYCKKGRTVGAVKTTYGVFFVLGGFCLLLTIIVTLIFPELRQRIHNKIAITHNASLMMAHFIWGSVMFLPIQVTITTCTILCVAVQFSFLGALFWMNAMCINMSSTFRTTQTISAQGGRSDTRRYWIYSAYAWGIPFLISTITVIMDYVEKPPFGLPRPGFACYCDFDRSSFSVFVYFYGPMLVLLTFNLVLYFFTTLKIMSVVRESKKFLEKSDSNATGRAIQLILYTKLFLLMGITWLTEIVGWAVGGSDNSGFLFAMDIINLLRAVFIFILFVCKPMVLKKIRGYLSNARGKIARTGSSHSTSDGSSLSTAPSRKVSQQDEAARKKSMDEWINMKSMERPKDKIVVRISEKLIEEPDEPEQATLIHS